jgi:hypothetical protein
MRLIARHHDGFTDHLLSWTLTAEGGGTAKVDASWLAGDSGEQQSFTIPFPVSRLARIADVLRTLKPKYDGRTDDAGHYSLQIETSDQTFATDFFVGMDFEPQDQEDVDAFMAIWSPISRAVEAQVALPGRRTL